MVAIAVYATACSAFGVSKPELLWDGLFLDLVKPKNHEGLSMDFTLDTSEKIVSLIAGLLAIASIIFVRNKAAKAGQGISNPVEPIFGVNNTNTNTNTSNITLNISENKSGGSSPTESSRDAAEIKRATRILFIDDDSDFKIVGILRKMGWEYTNIVTDIISLEQAALIEANVVFVDIQGVGRSMQYLDEGLGLALAIKRRYPDKKVIIYSAQGEGERFHEALQEADYNLPKTAEPIRFEDTILRVLKNG
ncbi:hypothetical protein [Pseudomonas aeruginosa]